MIRSMELDHGLGFRSTHMANVRLSLACWDYDRTRPLIDGRVKPEGIDLDIQILRPRQAFQRMLDDKEFQVSELSLASYTTLKARGACPYVAVPVALSKIFRHSCIYVRPDAGIKNRRTCAASGSAPRNGARPGS